MEVYERTKVLDGDNGLSNVANLFEVPEDTTNKILTGLKVTAEESEAAASDVWPTENSSLAIVNAFLGDAITQHVSGPTHDFIKSMVNSACNSIMQTDIFGADAPVQLVTILPDVILLDKFDPVLQLKELILLAEHFSEHTILDNETFHKDLKFASFSGGTETVKTAHNVKDKCTGLAQKLASIIFTEKK